MENRPLPEEENLPAPDPKHAESVAEVSPDNPEILYSMPPPVPSSPQRVEQQVYHRELQLHRGPLPHPDYLRSTSRFFPEPPNELSA